MWCTFYATVQLSLVIVHLMLINGSSLINLTVEGGVSLIGPQCPGTARLFCEGVDLTSMTWMYNGTVMINRFIPTDPITTTNISATPGLNVSVQLTSVSQSSLNPIFANFSSILTVDLSQLEQQNIMSINCGDPVYMDTVPVNVHIKPETVPGDPQIVQVYVNYTSANITTIQVKWKKKNTVIDCHDEETWFVVSLLWDGINSSTIVSNSICRLVCEFDFNIHVSRTGFYLLTIQARSSNRLSNIVFQGGTIIVPSIQCEAAQFPLNSSAGCHLPVSPLGSEVTYHCDDGLLPTGVMTSTCRDVGGRGEWVPDPAKLVCSLEQSGDDNSLSLEAVAGVSAAASFFVALMMGFLLGSLVMYLITNKSVKKVYSQSQTADQANTQPATPAGPVYEEVSSAKSKEAIELKTNQAYETHLH